MHHIARSYRFMNGRVSCLRYAPHLQYKTKILVCSFSSQEGKRAAKESLERRPITSKVVLYWGTAPPWKKLLITSAVIIYAIINVSYWIYAYKSYHLGQEQTLEVNKNKAQTYGELAVGGPFELTNTKGEIVSTDTLEGSWVLLYFGFTYCPDICPEQMQLLGDMVDSVKAEHNIDVIPIMISIDNERDTPKVLEEYIRDYNPKIVGLCGTDEQLDHVCNAYRCYRSKGQSYDDPNDYILDHTVTQYLINPNGKTIGYFLSEVPLDRRIEILMNHIEKYNAAKQTASEEESRGVLETVKGYLGIGSVQS